MKFLTKIKNKNETGVENEKIPHLFDSLSNSGIENNEEKIEINTRSFSADITSNIDKWGLDIPFELISSDVKITKYIKSLIFACYFRRKK